MTHDLILAIDQGTSSTRAIAYDVDWMEIASSSRRLTTDHPQPGWAEQDPTEVLESVVATVAHVLAQVGGRDRIGAVGIANQGETVVAWDRRTGAPLGPAVLWHCRRSLPIVDRVRAAGHEPAIRQISGLPLDPYFSASKIRWLIEEVPAVAEAASAGRLAVGTVDAWLTARLAGRSMTDPSTASRTQLLDLTALDWDERLLGWWDVPRAALPEIRPSVGDLGTIEHEDWGGPLPLRAMLCDQQAALVGQGGHRPGVVKATYGTGVFVLANAGHAAPEPPAGILATVGWTDRDGRPTYALDGGVFSAGALLDWLHDGLGLLDDPARLDDEVATAADAGGIRILPALSGLGAPWWQPAAKVVIAGLTAAATPGQMGWAAIDAIAQRAADVVEAMAPALPEPAGPLRVDGGLTRSRALVQRQADLLGRPIEVAARSESTALGVAAAAAIGTGRITEQDAAAVAGTARTVEPQIGREQRCAQRSAWTTFVERAIELEGAAP